MYILVRKEIWDRDLGHAALSIAHAMAAASRSWHGDPEFEDWADNSFRKVLCLVSDREFEKAKTYFGEDRFLVMTECALPGEEMSMVFFPREEWPRFFGSLKLLR